MGFRKLVVGNRDFRISWREFTDQNNNRVLEIAEVWAVGVRADSEIYEEMTERVQRLKIVMSSYYGLIYCRHLKLVVMRSMGEVVGVVSQLLGGEI